MNDIYLEERMEKDAAAKDQEKFRELLDGFRTVMLITHALPHEGLNRDLRQDDVEVTSRPMQVARLDDNCDLWFITDETTAKVDEIEREGVVHVVAQDENSRFVSLRGVAHVHRDPKLIHELWSEPYKVWFPNGPDTPGICVIHVEAHEGQYWDNQGVDKVRYLLRAAKAYATGTRVERTEDAHGTVDLHSSRRASVG